MTPLERTDATRPIFDRHAVGQTRAKQAALQAVPALDPARGIGIDLVGNHGDRQVGDGPRAHRDADRRPDGLLAIDCSALRSELDLIGRPRAPPHHRWPRSWPRP